MALRRKFKNWYFSYLVRKKAKTVKGFVFASGRTNVSKETKLGSNVNFNGADISGKVTIGDNFHSSSGLQIMASWHNYNGDKIPYDNTFIEKEVVIGDHVWIGNDVIILGGVTIGEGAIIQTKSVVSTDIPPLSIAGGNPAQVFKSRDPIKFNKLKKEQKWHIWD